MTDSGKAISDKDGLSPIHLLFAAMLILLWFVPDLAQSPVLFPFQMLAEAQGSAALVAMLTPPLGGALLALLFAVKKSRRLLLAASFVIAILASAVIILFGKPAFLIGPTGCAAIAAIALCTAVFLGYQFQSEKLLFLAASALPSALAVYAVYGAATGAYPAVYLHPYKLPVSLFATMCSAALSLFQLLGR